MRIRGRGAERKKTRKAWTMSGHGSGSSGQEASPRPADTSGRQDEVTTAVLDAAAKLFADQGIRRTTVRDIAAAAGVSHPLVHAYLGTKEAILAAVFARHGELARRHGADKAAKMPELAAHLARYALGERRDFARLSARAALEGVPFPLAESAFPGTRALADYAAQLAREPDGETWYPGIGPRVLVASLIAVCIGWAALGDALLAAAGLDEITGSEADERLVSFVVGVFRASLPARAELPPFPGGHLAPAPRQVAAPVAPPPAAPPPGPPNRRGGRARATEQILRAAEVLYGSGRQDPTVREVAEAAGVSHALVHRYTGSKEHLEALVLERNEQRVIAATRQAASVQQAAVWLLREDLNRGRPYLRLGATVALDGRPSPRDDTFPAARHLVSLARSQAQAATAPAPFPGDPGFSAAACMAMAGGWVLLDSWLPHLVSLDVPRMAGFDENFLAVVDCALTAYVPA